MKQENDLIESPSIVVEGYNDIAGKLTASEIMSFIIENDILKIIH